MDRIEIINDFKKYILETHDDLEYELYYKDYEEYIYDVYLNKWSMDYVNGVDQIWKKSATDFRFVDVFFYILSWI